MSILIGIIHIRDIYHIHELQFHLASVETGRTTSASPNLSDSTQTHAAQHSVIVPAARIREIIFVSFPGLHRAGDIVPSEVAALLLNLPYLNRIVFDAAWDSETEQRALAEFDDSLRTRTCVELGGE